MKQGTVKEVTAHKSQDKLLVQGETEMQILRGKYLRKCLLGRILMEKKEMHKGHKENPASLFLESLTQKYFQQTKVKRNTIESCLHFTQQTYDHCENTTLYPKTTEKNELGPRRLLWGCCCKKLSQMSLT